MCLKKRSFRKAEEPILSMCKFQERLWVNLTSKYFKLLTWLTTQDPSVYSNDLSVYSSVYTVCTQCVLKCGQAYYKCILCMISNPQVVMLCITRPRSLTGSSREYRYTLKKFRALPRCGENPANLAVLLDLRCWHLVYIGDLVCWIWLF